MIKLLKYVKSFLTQALDYNTITILKGFHYSNMAPRLIFGKLRGVTFDVKFHESCRYIVDESCEKDWNKLIGFCDILSHHHKNSFRVGWRYNKELDVIEICEYLYIAGERFINKKGTVRINVEEKISLCTPYDHLNNVRVLRPYFGGNCKAPHDIKIDLKVKYF